MNTSLRSLTKSDSVTNLFLFIADSVKADAVSEKVTSLGVSGTSISASSFTASSVPSLLTGGYPSTHRVWHFNDELPERPLLLEGRETFRMNAETIWGGNDPDKEASIENTRRERE